MGIASCGFRARALDRDLERIGLRKVERRARAHQPVAFAGYFFETMPIEDRDVSATARDQS